MLDFLIFQQLFAISCYAYAALASSTDSRASICFQVISCFSTVLLFSLLLLCFSRLVGKSCNMSENKAHTIVKFSSFRNISILKTLAEL